MSLSHLRTKLASALCLVLAGLAGCGGGAALTGQGGAGGTAPVDTTFAARDASELFAWPTVPTFDFTMPADRWTYLQAHALDEDWEPATVAFDGHNLGETALRFKGSYGSLVNCVDEKTGAITCPKLSLKTDFAEYDGFNRFFGLKKINFHSMNGDPSKMHDRLGYDLYREMGIVSPRASWAVVRVNGQSYGLYSMVEEIDGRLTADRFEGGGNGNLYKEVWPVGDEEGYFAAGLENNRGTATHDGFRAFSGALAAATTAEGLASALATFTDPIYVARFMAVDDAINNVDGPTAFYCDKKNPTSRCYNHNYFWYQEEARPLFWIIPWDLDATMTAASFFGTVPHWTVAGGCDARFTVWGTTIARAPGCDPVFQAVAARSDAYHYAIDELLAGPFSEAAMSTAIETHRAYIADAVAADPLLPGTGGWLTAVAQLGRDLGTLRQRLTAYGKGLEVAPYQLAVPGMNDFETVAPIDVALGVSAIANPQSTVTTTLGTTAPLGGSQDLRVDFVYRNEAPPKGAWTQWSVTSLAFAGGSHDLSTATGLRMLVKSDKPRRVRVQVVSPAQPSANKGIRFGWYVQATATPQMVDLPFATAALPEWVAAGLPDQLAPVLAGATGIDLQPLCTGQNSSGYLPDGKTDSGALQVDAVEIY
jgi:spore coat protein H